MDAFSSAGVCHIDLDAIAHNFRVLGSPDSLMPVIKADAYGHGLVEIARELDSAGAARFAVGLAQEGVMLRKMGRRQQIVLLMGCVAREDWEQALRHELTPLIGSFQELQDARELLARFPGKSLAVAIKVDTGMSRLGFKPDEAAAITDLLMHEPGLRPEMLVSHLACADMPEQEEFTQGQIAAFDEFYAVISRVFPAILRSIGNSAGLITGHNYEIARPGLALYGYNPLPGAALPVLKPAMSVSAPILAVRELAPGDSVSYGRTFVAQKPMRIAVIGCGYAAGFNRLLSGKASILVNGQRCQQIGRICMSMACIDVSAVEQVKRGDQAWLMGGGDNQVTAVELAERLGTIPYELLCLLGGLNQRVYERECWHKVQTSPERS